MLTVKASDLFVRCLENEGVKFVFGVPGEENLDLLESLEKSSIEFVSVRHEQAAAFMADAHGRLTGHAGVCLSTLGPGATNLCTGIADAFLDHAPLVAITAQTERRRRHKESHQFIEIRRHFRSITKWTTSLPEPMVIPEIVRKAFKVAELEKPGPTHIEIPEDVAGDEISKDELMPPLKIHEKEPIRVSQKSLKHAAKLMNESKHPIILVGNGAIRSQASHEVRTFAEALQIPVANTFMAKGVFSDKSGLSLGTIGLQAKDYVFYGFENADLVITIGYDFVEYSPEHWNPSGKKNILHIDSVPAEIDQNYQVACEVVGDIRGALGALQKLVRKKKATDEYDAIRDFIRHELTDFKDDRGFPVKPQKILWDIREVLDDNDILVSDVGAHKMWIGRLFPTYEPNTVLISNGLAAMGFSLPSAIAAKLLYPSRRVLSVCGDAGFMMNVQELETAVRLNLPIVILIFNDSAHGLIEWKARSKFQKKFDYGMKFENPDFVKLAESFGGKGYRISKGDNLQKVLKDAFATKKLCLIDVPVDYSENERLTKRLGGLVCAL